MRPVRATALVALLTAALLLSGVPAADASPARHQWFLVFARVEAPTARLVAVGPVSGVGTLTAESVTFDEPTSSNEETDVIALEGGTLTVAVHGSFSTWPFTLEPPSCTQHGTLHGTWTITGSSGAYAGATGGGTFTGAFFTYGPRTAGGCDTGSADPIRGFSVGPMTGTVSLPE